MQQITHLLTSSTDFNFPFFMKPLMLKTIVGQSVPSSASVAWQKLVQNHCENWHHKYCLEYIFRLYKQRKSLICYCSTLILARLSPKRSTRSTGFLVVSVAPVNKSIFYVNPIMSGLEDENRWDARKVFTIKTVCAAENLRKIASFYFVIEGVHFQHLLRYSSNSFCKQNLPQ